MPAMRRFWELLGRSRQGEQIALCAACFLKVSVDNEDRLFFSGASTIGVKLGLKVSSMCRSG
jgi:hypothetical protein